MAIEPELAELMTQTVGLLATGSVDGYGKRTYKASQPIWCHLDGKAVEVAGPDGTVLTGAGTAWLDDHYPLITTSDRITLPNGGGSKGLVEVKTAYDETGPHHTKIVYGQS